MAFDAAADSDAKMDMRALWLALRRRWLRIVLVTLLLLAATFAVLHFVPKTYESTSSILVENRQSVYTRPASDTSGSSSLSADDLSALISSQIGLVKSRDTLLTVVRSEKLASVPEFNGTATSAFSPLLRLFKKPTERPEDIAVDTLGDHLTVTRERDSSLISIAVRSTDPTRASDLANAIAHADVSRRAGLSLADTADASQWLEQQITQLRGRVADAETKVANYKVANDLYVGTNSTSLLDQQMAEIATQITSTQERKNTAQSRSALIRGLLAAGQPIDGIDDVRNSVTIQQLMQQKAQLTTQRAQLLATLLPTHPTVEAVTAQIAAVDRQIGVEGRRVADALDAEAKIEGNVQTSLEGNLDALKAKAANATRGTVTLDALNREATADRDLLASYMARYRDATARTNADADLPDVRVVTLAAPSSTPASPRTTLIMGAVAFVSLAVQIGSVLFGELISGRAIVEPARGAEREEEVAGEEAVAVADAAPPVPTPAEVPEPVALAPSGPVEATDGEARRRSGRGLRTWFTRHAHAVGGSLTAFEPPMSNDPAARLEAVAAAAPEVEADRAAPATDALKETEGQADTALAAEPAMSVEAADEGAGTGAEVDGDVVGKPAIEPAGGQRLAELSADLVLGRARIVLLSALEDYRDSERLCARLIAEVVPRGVSVVCVDAGSGRPSTEPGITDLSAERASFGDVVHKTAEDGLAQVPWGHLTTMDRRSSRPITLIEALSDIYEVVVVLTGRVGMSSSLALFAGLPCRLLLVGPDAPDPEQVNVARADLSALGFDAAELIAAPPLEAEVA